MWTVEYMDLPGMSTCIYLEYYLQYVYLPGVWKCSRLSSTLSVHMCVDVTDINDTLFVSDMLTGTAACFHDNR